jgi:hypothetical protein
VRRETRRLLRQIRRRATPPILYLFAVGVGLLVFLSSIRSCHPTATQSTAPKSMAGGVNLTIERR